jgi:AcrR family transcriptional regulator
MGCGGVLRSPRLAGRAPKKSSKKPLVRGEPVVRRALSATLHELASAGYAALKVEDIASRARVNKTTIYRRWPTKEALVRAALLSISESHKSLPIPDTGSVREDLMTVVRRTLILARSPEGKVTMRVVAAESPHSKLGRIAESVRQGHDSIPLAILQRARKRGELRAGVDPSLLFEVLRSACMQMILQTGEIKERFVEQLVDLLLVGALHPKSLKTRRTPRRD